MEDSESAEKQENTGIGPASACRGNGKGCLYGELCSVLVLRSAYVGKLPQTPRARTRVSKDGDERLGLPSCFETHRSAFGLWRGLRSRRAATLLSMRARGSSE